jgi:hypothetical protein
MFQTKKSGINDSIMIIPYCWCFDEKIYIQRFALGDIRLFRKFIPNETVRNWPYSHHRISHYATDDIGKSRDGDHEADR